MGDDKREESFMKKSGDNRKVRRKMRWGITLVLILIAVVLVFAFRNSSFSFSSVESMIEGEDGTVSTITQTSLEEVLEISELSTVENSYNSIAYVYEEDGVTLKYYVAYEGTVTAGIDFTKIEIVVDQETKQITLEIPACEIIDTIVDFGSMDYIFNDSSYNTESVSQEAYTACREDLEEDARKEDALLNIARENAIAVVEALINPWVEQLDEEYTVTIQ